MNSCSSVGRKGSNHLPSGVPGAGAFARCDPSTRASRRLGRILSQFVNQADVLASRRRPASISGKAVVAPCKVLLARMTSVLAMASSPQSALSARGFAR